MIFFKRKPCFIKIGQKKLRVNFRGSKKLKATFTELYLKVKPHFRDNDETYLGSSSMGLVDEELALVLDGTTANIRLARWSNVLASLEASWSQASL